jgi:hypothetical protein
MSSGHCERDMRTSRFGTFLLVVAIVWLMTSAPTAMAIEQEQAKLASAAVSRDIKLFNGQPRLFANIGPSTTMYWPLRLQRKLYRYTDKVGADCPLRIVSFSRHHKGRHGRDDQLLQHNTTDDIQSAGYYATHSGPAATAARVPRARIPRAARLDTKPKSPIIIRNPVTL